MFLSTILLIDPQDTYANPHYMVSALIAVMKHNSKVFCFVIMIEISFIICVCKVPRILLGIIK